MIGVVETKGRTLTKYFRMRRRHLDNLIPRLYFLIVALVIISKKRLVLRQLSTEQQEIIQSQNVTPIWHL
jgi:hypothetical protein